MAVAIKERRRSVMLTPDRRTAFGPHRYRRRHFSDATPAAIRLGWSTAGLGSHRTFHLVQFRRSARWELCCGPEASGGTPSFAAGSHFWRIVGNTNWHPLGVNDDASTAACLSIPYAEEPSPTAVSVAILLPIAITLDALHAPVAFGISSLYRTRTAPIRRCSPPLD